MKAIVESLKDIQAKCDSLDGKTSDDPEVAVAMSILSDRLKEFSRLDYEVQRAALSHLGDDRFVRRLGPDGKDLVFLERAGCDG